MSEVNQKPSKAAQEPEAASDKPPPGAYLKTGIPVEIKSYAVEKLSGQDQNKKISVYPARENASYKGKILLNTDQFIVQSIGTEGKTAIVHEKKNMELVGQRLVWCDENKRMNGHLVQIHYVGEKPKMFPWNPEKEAERKAEKFAERDKSVMRKLEAYMENLSPAERKKIGKHIDAALGLQEKKPEAAKEASQKAKPTEKEVGMER